MSDSRPSSFEYELVSVSTFDRCFTAADGEIHTVHLAEERTGPEVQPSCAKTKMAPVINLTQLSP